MTTNIYDLSGVRTQGLSIQAIMPYVSDRAGTGTGWLASCSGRIFFRETFPDTLYLRPDSDRRTNPTL